MYPVTPSHDFTLKTVDIQGIFKDYYDGDDSVELDILVKSDWIFNIYFLIIMKGARSRYIERRE